MQSVKLNYKNTKTKQEKGQKYHAT
jgi:hypothetical protein